MQQSWLPHTETQGNTIATDINVEALHQKRLHAIHYNNPFGDLFHVDVDDWEDIYKLLCNIPTGNRRRKSNLAEHHKVDIALQMRGSAEWHYKFRPQHFIYDELCMVLQKRAFRLTEKRAIEIPLNVYHTKRYSNQVVVREIAFGPDCDSSVRGVSLFFDVSDKDVTVCTPQQAKRYRWKKGVKNTAVSPRSSPSPRSPSPFKPKTSTFDGKECFVMIRPIEKEAFDLSTKILQHHLGVLKSDKIVNLCDRYEARTALSLQCAALKETFDGLKASWKTWAWPTSEGRGKVDESTPVPPVDGLYKPTETLFADEKDEAPKVQRIWDSFVGEDRSSKDGGRRLAVFEQLSKGKQVKSGGGR